MHEHFISELGEEEFAELKSDYNDAFQMTVHADVRKGIVEDQTRPDGRKMNQIRPLSSETGFCLELMVQVSLHVA